jgi:hypothetical protein
MSPEQCLQESVDARSDVFALGVVLYELTTGRPAFPGDMIAAMNRAIDGRFTPPGQIVRDYPPALGMIVRRALATRAQDRYPSAAAFRAALEAFARQQLRLDTSTDALVRLLEARFGTPAWPDLATPPPVPTPPMMTMLAPRPADAATVALAPASVGSWPARRRSRSHRVTVGAIGVLAGALLGWQIARTSAASATEPPQPAAPAIEAIAPHPIAMDRVPPITEPAKLSAARVEPLAPATLEPVIVAPELASGPVVRASEGDGEPRHRRRRSHRKAKTPTSEVPAPPSRTADAMLPRSAR